ncbi:hypothetical protein STEG23_022213, partial [Scotinomys teguina]
DPTQQNLLVRQDPTKPSGPAARTPPNKPLVRCQPGPHTHKTLWSLPANPSYQRACQLAHFARAN